MSQSKQPRPVNDDVVQPQCFELPMRNETLHVPGNRPLSIAILLKYVDHVAFKIDLEGQLKYIGMSLCICIPVNKCSSAWQTNQAGGFA